MEAPMQVIENMHHGSQETLELSFKRGVIVVVLRYLPCNFRFFYLSPYVVVRMSHRIPRSLRSSRTWPTVTVCVQGCGG